MSLIEQAAKRLEELRRAGVLPSRALGRHALEVDTKGKGQNSSRHPIRAEVDLASDSLQPIRNAVASDPTARKTVSQGVKIDKLRLASQDLVSPADPRSRIAEEFRSIKRPLIRNAQGKSAVPIKNGNLIMITSALPGEGKSTSAVNLAISIAMELDNTVLLVDADVAKPSVPAMLGLTLERGLLDVVVEDSLDLSDVMVRTDIDKLSILPSGSRNARATELLASETMARLLNEMSIRYPDRIIIFDSPPLLLTNEARALAAHMGQIVLVVEAERTTQTAVQQALAAIESCPVKLLMLNKAKYGRRGSGLGYGGYGYGDYTPYGYGA